MIQTFHSEGIPDWFTDAMGPLVRRHPQPLTDEDARDYWAILKIVPEMWLRAAVLMHLSQDEKPFIPQPATLLRLARKIQRDWLAERAKRLPPCPLCGTTGTVWVPSPVNPKRSDAHACRCERGRQKRLPPYDPEHMPTEDEFKQAQIGAVEMKCLTVEEALAGIGNIEKAPKPSQRTQLRRLARWEQKRIAAAPKPDDSG